MDCAKDLLQLDSEVNNLNLLKEDDPFLPVLPSPEIPKELLEEGFKTPLVTPLHSPHAFLQMAILTPTCDKCDTYGFRITIHLH